MDGKQETLKDIEQTLGFVPQWLALVPDSAIEVEWGLIKGREMAETAIPNKYKELIGLGVAAQMQCPYSVVFHTEVARLCGATEEELEEAVGMAKLTAGWGAYFQGMQVDMEQFRREAKEVCDAIAAKQKAA